MNCLFRMCRWVWHFNAQDGNNRVGVYQCSRCKKLSIGSPRNAPQPPGAGEDKAILGPVTQDNEQEGG